MPQGKKPAQEQAEQPGLQSEMEPEPESDPKPQTGQLVGKTALITGGDSGIGRAVALLFAQEGANIVFTYTEHEKKDADEVVRAVESRGRRALALSGDIKRLAFCNRIVERTIKKFGQLDILVNNAAVQFERESLTEITDEQMKETFETNIYAYIRVTRAALLHLQSGSAIINTASVTAYQGNPSLIDYSATKGAIISFTRALANSVAEGGIRVNAVAPGPIWTPLIPSSFSKEHVAQFGGDTGFGRPGEPNEVAPAYLFLASEGASFITGATLHVNGGSFTCS